MISYLPCKKPEGPPSPENSKAKGLEEIKGLGLGREKKKGLLWLECIDKK